MADQDHDQDQDQDQGIELQGVLPILTLPRLHLPLRKEPPLLLACNPVEARRTPNKSEIAYSDSYA